MCTTLDLPAEKPPAFRYVGGDPGVDFVNTVDWTAHGLAEEQLGDYARLAEWAAGAGLLAPGTAASLHRRGEERRAEASRVLRRAHALRNAVRRAFLEAAEGAVSAKALDGFADELVAALASRVLMPAGGSPASAPPARWEWRDAERSLDSPLWGVAMAAATLLTSPDAAKLRVCGGTDCGWMYVDRSRNGLRRWCEMATCGTRAKSRRRAERRHG